MLDEAERAEHLQRSFCAPPNPELRQVGKKLKFVAAPMGELLEQLNNASANATANASSGPAASPRPAARRADELVAAPDALLGDPRVALAPSARLDEEEEEVDEDGDASSEEPIWV